MSAKVSKYVYIAAVVCCVLPRVYLKLAAVDPGTGFYTGSELPPMIFNILLLLSVAALLAGGYLNKLPAGRMRLVGASPMMRVCCILSGAAALLYSLSQAGGLINNFYRHSFGSGTAMQDLLLSVLSLLAFGIAPLGAAAIFFYVGSRARGNVSLLGLNPYLCLLPALWQIILLLKTFLGYTAVRSVSDQMLTVVTMIFAVPFLIAFGRVASRTGVPKGMRQLGVYALPFSVLALTLSVGQLAGTIAGKMVEAGPNLATSLLYLILGLLAASCVFSSFGRPVPQAQRRTQPEEPQEGGEAEE